MTLTTLAGPAAVDAPRPVDEGDRIASIDVLRGVAVLGILAMNIIAFAYPFAAYINPANRALQTLTGPFEGLNRVVWTVCHFVFDTKMMTIFSMLFGAGIALTAGRLGARGGRPPGVHYRRTGWLLLIGLAHAYAVWYGDILVTYALCALLIYPFWRLRPWVLLSLGTAAVLVVVPLDALLMGPAVASMRDSALAAEAAIAAGREPSPGDAFMLEQWQAVSAEIDPGAAQVEEQVRTMRGPLLGILWTNVSASLMVQTQYFLFWGLWRAGGAMLIGMALLKLGVFSAARSDRYYLAMLAFGYGPGLAIVGLGLLRMEETEFGVLAMFRETMLYNYVGSVLVALGHIALVMLACRRGIFPAAARRLAAVGRMALTNYLAQSLICTFIFFGWGLGYFGSVERAPLYLVVLGVWVLELAWSPWWLDRFRFGPAEWLWRSLTYWRRQPMRRARPVAAPA